MLADVTQSGTCLTVEQQEILATFGSMQHVRGARTRAENEAVAEFIVKLMSTRRTLSHHAQQKARVRQARERGRTPSRGNGRHHERRRRVAGMLTDTQMREWLVRPHQNDFLKSIAERGQLAFNILLKRPLTVVHLSSPSLLIGDEPMVLLEPSPVLHQPGCSMTDRDRARALNRAHAIGRGAEDILHIYPVRPRALLYAEQIAFPVAPDTALVWGPPGADEPTHVELDGAEAAYGIELINRRQGEDAYEWLAGTPENDALAAAVVPERGPVMRVCTGNTAARAAMDVFPGRPLRLRSVE